MPARSRRLPQPALVVLLVAVLATACSSPSTRGTRENAPSTTSNPAAASVPSLSKQLAALRKALPPGFGLPGDDRLPAGPVTLTVAPDPTIRVSEVHPVSLTDDPADRAALEGVLSAPGTVIVRPVLVSTTALEPSQRIVVAGGDLAPGSRHLALVLLAGPGYVGDHLVTVVGRAMACVLTLPASMPGGQWVLAVEDLSALRSARSSRAGGGTVVRGTEYVDAGVFEVG
jgi:hypothetical protein